MIYSVHLLYHPDFMFALSKKINPRNSDYFSAEHLHELDKQSQILKFKPHAENIPGDVKCRTKIF